MFNTTVELALGQIFIKLDAESDVFINRHRERRRLLEHHAHARTKQIEIELRIQQILTIEQNFTSRALTRIEVIHTVQNTQQCGLATARRADESRHRMGSQTEIDILQRL